MQDILANHEPVPLPDEAEKELQRILRAAEEERLSKS
jgi:hypothetical protein